MYAIAALLSFLLSFSAPTMTPQDTSGGPIFKHANRYDTSGGPIFHSYDTLRAARRKVIGFKR
jgi:hypothetical protein